MAETRTEFNDESCRTTVNIDSTVINRMKRKLVATHATKKLDVAKSVEFEPTHQ